MRAARRYRTSLEVRWPSPTRETYEEGHAAFDVQAAKAFLSTHAVPVEYRPAVDLSDWIQTMSSGRRNPWAAKIDAARVPRADPGVPLILAETPKRVYLIDGHHRLERGRQLGYSEFPVVLVRDPILVMSLMRGSTNRLAFWWLWQAGPAAVPSWGPSRPTRGTPRTP